MKRRMKQRAIAILMTVLMAVGLMPADLMGGVSRVKADPPELATMTENGTESIVFGAENSTIAAGDYMMSANSYIRVYSQNGTSNDNGHGLNMAGFSDAYAQNTFEMNVPAGKAGTLTVSECAYANVKGAKVYLDDTDVSADATLDGTGGGLLRGSSDQESVDVYTYENTSDTAKKITLEIQAQTSYIHGVTFTVSSISNAPALATMTENGTESIVFGAENSTIAADDYMMSANNFIRVYSEGGTSNDNGHGLNMAGFSDAYAKNTFEMNVPAGKVGTLTVSECAYANVKGAKVYLDDADVSADATLNGTGGGLLRGSSDQESVDVYTYENTSDAAKKITLEVQAQTSYIHGVTFTVSSSSGAPALATMTANGTESIVFGAENSTIAAGGYMMSANNYIRVYSQGGTSNDNGHGLNMAGFSEAYAKNTFEMNVPAGKIGTLTVSECAYANVKGAKVYLDDTDVSADAALNGTGGGLLRGSSDQESVDVYTYENTSSSAKKITLEVQAQTSYIHGVTFTVSSSASEPVDGYTVSTPDKNTTYYFDFSDENSEFVSGVKAKSAETVSVGLLSFDTNGANQYFHSAFYGVEFQENNVFTFKVAGSAYIVFTGDSNSNANLVAATETGSIENGKTQSSKTEGHATLADCIAKGENTVVFEYTGGAGTVAVTVGKSKAYINAAAIIPIDESLGGEAESFTFVMDEHTVGDVVKTGEYKFADSKLLLAGYTDNGTITQYAVKSGKTVMMDGKEVNSYWAGKRHAQVNDIPTIPGEGDGTLTVFTPAGKGMMTVYFNSTSFMRVWDFNTDGTRNGYVDSPSGITQYSYAVAPGHVYVMSTTGATNNMFYAGYKYIVNEKIATPVTVTNVDATISDSLEITAVDADLGGDPIDITVDTTSLNLLKDHTYKLSTNDGGVKALCGDSETFTVTGEAIAITLHNVADETLTGQITGADASTVTSLTFTNMLNGTTYEAAIAGDSYTCFMKPGEYYATVITTDAGFTYDRVSVVEGAENVDEVFVEVTDPASKRSYSYSDIVTLPTTGFVAVEDGKPHCVAGADATITIPVSGKARVVVKAYYAADFAINGEQKTVTSGTTSKIDKLEEIVEGDATITFNATSFLTGIDVIPLIPFKSEINVPGDYATLNEASDAILGMEDRPEGEEGRVTINLNTDLFEQTVMAADRVTLKGNGHTISWYYGVGTLYYSIEEATGLYSERLARDRYSSVEGNGSLWGGVFIVRGDDFIAENTTFKNTYNYELTEAEKNDIAGTTLSVDRLADGADVSSYKYKERSNAFYIEADRIECYNCRILSSQDTLGRNGGVNNNYHTYFKDCVIGGNVDYICGEFAAVFDNCELQWKTYTGDAGNNAKVGYIVAPKTSPYVFRNCFVTTDGNEGSDLVVGCYGRTWGANSNASFINTETNGHISDAGWGEMGAGEYASATFNEYNNTNDGEVMYTTGCTGNTEEQVADYIDTAEVTAVDTVLGSWRPVHYHMGEDAIQFNDAESDEIPAAVLTDAVKARTGATTVEDLIKYIETELSNSPAVTVMGTPTGYKTVDITVLYKKNGTGDWEPINGSVFPAEGLKVVLSYPEGTGKTGFNFAVAHLIVNGFNGQTPGEIEFLPYALTDDGLEVTIRSTSPFTIAWKAIDDSKDGDDDTTGTVTTDDSDDDDDDDDDDDATDVIATIAKSDVVVSPKTFDKSKFVPEVAEEEFAKFVQRQEVEDLLITPQAKRFPFGVVVMALFAMVAFIGGEVIYFGRKKQK